jgi:phosphatidylinositol-3-phosphatase
MKGVGGLLLLIVLGLAGFAGAARVSASAHFQRACHHHHVCTTTTTTTTTTGGGGRYTHVVWIVMENHSYSEIIGSSSAPYINSLAKTYGNATQMFAESHPSLPNYIAMTSGGTQGITDDNGPSAHPLSVPSIFSQLGTGARSLEESMPSNCDKSSSGNYAVKHNPEAYYTNLNGTCSTNDVPLGSTPDISAQFTFITPNLCDDMHSNTCSGSSNVIAQGDAWLKGFIPKLLATSQYTSGSTVIFLTWDEDNGSSGNHIPTLVISPTTKAVVSSTKFTHYSMLRTAEEILGLPRIGGAQTANDMLSAFNLG